MIKVVGVRFKTGGKVYFFDPQEFDIKKGDYVIVDTARGLECGLCVQGVHEESTDKIVRPLKAVNRIASPQDVEKMQQNRKDEKKAFDICLEKIAKHKLEMKLIDVEYTFDRSKVLFYFTADGRVDFRELVKELAQVFRTRIELRQIGVRDESKMMGGVGVCGQQFCCSRFLSDFTPVSIKMAKEQGLSLNPSKISGSCGRLMCCLSYEQPAYEHLNSITPGVGSLVKTSEGNGIVTEVSLLRSMLKVRLDKNKEGIPKEFALKDVTVLKRVNGNKKSSSADQASEKELRALED
ncbi:MAG: stage 0 sporulation family protein [Oscillospiraceae bacterium]|nr:stage 0 sporulation family protein [Oscillospiraceae bacterium]